MVIIGDGRISFGVGIGIEDDLGRTDNNVVFCDDFRHSGSSAQGVNCSFSILSSRLCSGSNNSKKDSFCDTPTVTRLTLRTSV